MILVVQCRRCKYSRRFSDELRGRRFRCPNCRKGVLSVPNSAPSGAYGTVKDRSQEVEESFKKKSGRLYECVRCKTVVWGEKGGSKKRACPDCRNQQEFSESKLTTVKLKDLPDPVDAANAEIKSRGAIGAFGGAILGALIMFLAMQFGLVDSSTPTTPPIIAAPHIETVETPSGKYRIAHPDDFIMEGKVFTVTKVIDGDTAHLDELPNHAKVRFLGVDTPETKHATKGVQFWGREASAFTKKTLEGQRVIVHVDPKQQYGVFGRPLVYLELFDGRDFNRLLVEKGYARATKEYPFDRMADYLEKQKVAQDKQLGMWNEAKRKVFDAKKAKAAQAALDAKKAAEQKEIERRKQAVKDALAKGGRYLHGKTSKTIHEPWCNRRPRKSPVFTPDLETLLKTGYKKHNCFKDSP